MSLMNKFAGMGYAEEDRARLPGILGNLQTKNRRVKSWYLKKFGVCEMEEKIICGEQGFYIKLPLTEEQAFDNPELAEFFVCRAFDEMRKSGVGILIPPSKLPVEFSTEFPSEFPSEFPRELRIADGKNIFAFLIMPAIKKALGLRGKNIKAAEILIIDGDRELTENLIENIYPHVNFLSLISENDYTQQASEIFDDCGLNLFVSTKNRQVLESADVVINTSSGEECYDFYFKRGAVYFELGKNGNKFLELLRKRSDILAADDILVFAKNGRTKTKEFEAAFYSMCGEYRRLFCRKFDKNLAFKVGARIEELSPEVSGLICMGKVISKS